MKRGLAFFGILWIGLFLCSSFVVAEEGSSEVASAAAQALVCKAEFTAKVVSSTLTAMPNASELNVHVEKLNADITQLKTLASAGNASEVKAFLKGTYEPDVKAAREAIQQWRKDHLKGLSKEQRQVLQTNYGDLKKTLDACHLAALKLTAEKRMAEFNSELDRYDALTARLGERGLDITQLAVIVSDARTQIVSPLQQAIRAATTEYELKAALKRFCLHNGCKDGMNYHLAAKYNLEKATALIAFVKAQGNVSAEKITQAEASLENARATLARAGTGQYGEEDKQVGAELRTTMQASKEAHRGALKKVAVEEQKKLRPMKAVQAAQRTSGGGY